MNVQFDFRELVRPWDFPGTFAGAEPCGSGHINDTYGVTFEHAGRRVRHLLQRINHQVFPAPAALMENVRRVTAHLGEKLAGGPEAERRALRLKLTRTGAAFHRDAAGNFWRSYGFIDGGRTFDAPASPAQARAAAHAFGRFQTLLADLPGPRLHDTIPDFHHTPKRFAAFERALQADVAHRAQHARPEIEFARRHQALCAVLLDAQLPERVTHNDTKLNNVMFDAATGEALCVLDLDTVMPGLAPYDFGDLVRSATCPAAEDERDLAKVAMQFPLFAALAEGYLAATADWLTPAEKKHLALAGRLITFETGLRFLTDYLAGDVYFKTHRPGQNLDRCRAQFKLAESIAEQEDAMNRLVAGW